MADVLPGVTPVPNNILEEIRTELQKLNDQTASFSTFMQKVFATNQKTDVRQQKFEQTLKTMFTVQQEKDLLKMDYQGRQLKELVDLNKQILKESQKSAKAVEEFQKAQKSLEYQSKSAYIANDYAENLRKSQDKNTLGTLAHHLGSNYSGIAGLIGMLGRGVGIKNTLGVSAPGDFMARKKAEERNLSQNAGRSLRQLDRDFQGRTAVGADVYADMQGTEGALDSHRMDFLNRQKAYMKANYASGYKRRGTGSGGGKSSQENADEAQAKQNPSPADVARQSAGTANGFLLLYSALTNKQNDPMKELAQGPQGGGLISSLPGMLAPLLPLLLQAALPLLIGGGIIALIAGAVMNTNQRNEDAKKVRGANGLSDDEVIKQYGTTNLEASNTAAYLKNGSKSGVSTATAYDSAVKASQMNISGNGDVSKVLVDTESKLRASSPWSLPNFRGKLTTDGKGNYFYGGVLVPASAQQDVMNHDEQGIFQHGSWSKFASDASTGLYKNMSFARGGMVPGGTGQASLATVHGGEMVLTSAEVTQMRQAITNGGGSPEMEKIFAELLEVNKALLEEMKKNTEVTGKNKPEPADEKGKVDKGDLAPQKQFQRSN